MTKAIRVATLVLALSVYAQAGIIQNDKTEEPPPPPPATSTTEGGAETEASAEGTVETDLTAAVSQATMDVLQSLLILF